MAIKTVFIILQLAFGLLLMLAILIQERGAALSETFGGSGAFFGTRRGGEKFIFVVTIVLATLFILISVASLLL